LSGLVEARMHKRIEPFWISREYNWLDAAIVAKPAVLF